MEDRIEFLLVEENEHDIAAIQRAWAKGAVPHRLHIAPGGASCLQLLEDRNRARKRGAPTLPLVVLLNDRMATMGGVETLKKIRNNKELSHVPVLMLMASDENRRELKTYRMGANAYIVKPTGADELKETIAVIVRFWELAELPQPTPAGEG